MATPNSISGNATNLAYAEEASLKVLPGMAEADAVWYGLEPNSYADLGATIATVARSPIINTRQRAKGTTTDLDAKAGFNTDLTQRNLTRLLQGFFFIDALEKPATQPLNGTQHAITSVTTGPSDYNAGAGLDAFKVGHLVNAKGFGKSANNGLKTVTAVAAGALGVAEALTAEAAPPAAAQLEAVGFKYAAGDLALTVVGNTIVLTSATIDPTTLALNVGEFIFVGGDAAGSFYANNTPFYGRVKSVDAATKTITLDLTMSAVIADAGAAKTIEIFFGKVLRNAIVAADIKRRSYNLERQLGNDGVDVQAQYVIGAVPNELTVTLATAAKVTADLTFVGMDEQTRTGTVGVKAGTRIDAPAEDALNTSNDIYAARLSVIDPATSDPTGLYAFATETKLTINNNVSGNKALATLGAFEANVGEFDVNGTMTAYFQTVAAVAAIRGNADVALSIVMAKHNSGIVIDFPLLGLGNGQNKVEKDKPIIVDLTQAMAKCKAGYTALMNFFEYLPTVAMAA